MRIFTVPFPVLLGPVDFSKLGDSQACGKLRALQRERVSVRTRAEARLDKERVHAQRGLRDSPHETQMPGNGGQTAPGPPRPPGMRNAEPTPAEGHTPRESSENGVRQEAPPHRPGRQAGPDYKKSFWTQAHFISSLRPASLPANLGNSS